MKKYRKILVLSLLVVSILVLSGCNNQKTTEKKIREDLQNHWAFSIHNVEIQEFDVIKRQTNDGIDEIYVHVNGENDQYSVSLSYKMVYELYDEGWLLETVEEYEDDNHKNQIVPLCGPSQEVLDQFTAGVDWESYSSLGSGDVSWELKEIGTLSLDNNAGLAEYIFEIKYELSYFTEIVTIPVLFHFVEIGPGRPMDWYAPTQLEISMMERSIVGKQDLCGKWKYHLERPHDFGVGYHYYDVTVNISEMKFDETTGRTYYTVDEYTFIDGEEKYTTSGEMFIYYIFDKDDGTIASAELAWATGGDHPQKCTSLEFYYGGLKSRVEAHVSVLELPIVLAKQ